MTAAYVPSERVPLHAPLEACVLCGDDAELCTAPGPGEPRDEYTCPCCGCSFTADGRVTAPAGSAFVDAVALPSTSGGGS